MNNKVAAGLTSALLITGACSSNTESEVPAAVVDAFLSTAELYPCDVVDIDDIRLATRALESDMVIGEGVLSAVTTKDGVLFGLNVPEQELIQSGKHEYMHARTDFSEITYLETPLIIDAETFVTGSIGFAVSFNEATIDEPDRFPQLDEGVIEWLLTDTADYVAADSASYLAVNTLTHAIAAIRKLDKDVVADMHCNSDIRGIIGLMKNKEPSGVNGNDFEDILLLYQGAFSLEKPFDFETLNFILNYPNS
jgi:hypothetical protein